MATPEQTKSLAALCYDLGKWFLIGSFAALMLEKATLVGLVAGAVIAWLLCRTGYRLEARLTEDS